MSAAHVFNPATFNMAMLSDGAIEAQQALVAAFFEAVDSIKTLLRSGVVIIHVPVSQGKDSTVVELIVMEAYRQLRASAEIEAERPMFLSTVDTLNESIPMKMYPAYCKAKIDRYAQEHGINLFYDFVTPGLNDEYFIKYNGGQKLVPNATRRGDCTIFLKLTPSERHVRTLLQRFANDPDMAHYAKATVITCVGSRTDEGSRRSGNMAQQGIRDKTADDLFAEMERVVLDKKSKTTIIKYAPIRAWSTDDVFDLLRLAGTKPLSRMLDGSAAPIPAFLSDFGLLLEIYGNGSNDVCEVAVGGNKQGAGCNGKARYGCWLCTMVPNDKSSTALTGYPRWSALGAEDALRVRDWLFRLSCDMDARALHARAFDPTGYNRVAMQPNVLKPKHLEKMVRYASQLAIDSARRAEEFKQLVAQGREMEHPGYADIANDTMIPPKAKRAFLEMYKEFAQTQIFTPFSEVHAVLLSFRWSIDGIGGAPYRPLAIWKQIERGEGRIPFPMLNSEYEARHGKIKLIDEDNKLPDAVMFSILKTEDPQAFAAAPVNLYDLWVRPNDQADLFEEDMNCTLERRANHAIPVTGQARFSYTVNVTASGTQVSVKLHDAQVSKVKIDGVAAKPMAADLLKTNYLNAKAQASFYAVTDKVVGKMQQAHASAEAVADAVRHQLAKTFAQEKEVKVGVPFLSRTTMPSGYQAAARKVDKKFDATRRVLKTVKGKPVFGNTRMVFSSPDGLSSLYEQHVCETSMLQLNFDSHTHKRINVHDLAASEDELFDVLNNLDVNAESFAQWKAFDGIEQALRIHDDYLRTLIKKRHTRGFSARDVRKYGGTHVAEHLLSGGPVMVKEDYWKTLSRILKRTQIFNDLGLFDFQSCSYQEVASHPQAITMRQHRQDRAKIIQALRQRRNATRRATRAALSAHRRGDYPMQMVEQVQQNFTTLANQARAAVSLMADQYLAHQVKMVFHTGDIAPVHRATAARLWLAQTLDGLNSTTKVMERTLAASQRHWIKDSPLAMCRLKTVSLPIANALAQMFLEVRQHWMPLHDALLALEAGTDVADYRARVKAVVTAHAAQLPEAVFLGGFAEDLFQFWRPNLENANRHVTGWCRSIADVVNVCDVFAEQMAQLTKDCAGRALATPSNLAQMSLMFDLAVA